MSVADASRIVTAIIRGAHSVEWGGRYNALLARPWAIMYHDVVESGKYSASGFAGATDWIGRPGFVNADQIRELEPYVHW